jgi:pimeloyl-ACP methyl ester carboxylesterase
MQRAILNGLSLEYEDSRSGEPVVLIHGAFIADAFRPLCAEPALNDLHRLISYRRRGYGGSGPLAAAASVADQADDCRRLLAHLNVRQAHVVGHSYGGIIALQLALDAPHVVGTLSLLEAGLLIGESADLYRDDLIRSAERFREVGAEVAVDEFLRMRWPEYRESLARAVPGALQQAVTDAATFYEIELPAGLAWSFGEAEARRIAQPVLVVLGGDSVPLHPRFVETYRLMLDWLPNAEGFLLPGRRIFCRWRTRAGWPRRSPRSTRAIRLTAVLSMLRALGARKRPDSRNARPGGGLEAVDRR